MDLLNADLHGRENILRDEHAPRDYFHENDHVLYAFSILLITNNSLNLIFISIYLFILSFYNVVNIIFCYHGLLNDIT
jgi:hypothetical protein